MPHLPAIAALRIAVFREWPYLYDGDAAYEQDYLRKYITSPRATVAAAFDGETLVGASTCLPLADEAANVTAPFRAAGLNISRYFYFGESVLLPAYRGQGIGVEFFKLREAQAAGFAVATFCAVQRPVDHPSIPPSHQPLDQFWIKRGYQSRPDLICKMSWKDVDAPEMTEKELMFWTKDLRG